MVPGIRTWLCRPVLMLSCIAYLACFSTGSDTILSGQSLFPNQTIISKEGNFELGFFSPGNSSKYYIGIWYKNISVHTVAWVANRDSPIPYQFSNKSFLELRNGNLHLYDDMGQRIWTTSSNSTTTASNTTQATLLDTGNLVLANGIDIIWQSFDYPGDTWLPGGKIGLNRVTNTTIGLVSWKNQDDPAQGPYSLKMDPTSNFELFMLGNSRIYWRSGTWQDGSFPYMTTNGKDLHRFSYASTDDGKYLVFNGNNSVLSRIVISVSGAMQRFIWSPTTQEWILFGVSPTSRCEVYAICGAFGVCDINYALLCSCLTGFEPRFEKDWNLQDFSGGCVRNKSLDCSRDKGRFSRIPHIRLPPYSESLVVGKDVVCEYACSINCSCNAYSYSSNGGCALWFGDLLDLESQPDGSTGGDLYVRLNLLEPPAKGQKTRSKSLPVGLAASIISVIFVSFCFFYYLWKRKHKRKGDGINYQNLLLLDLSSKRTMDKSGTTSKGTRVEEKNGNVGLPTFSFSSVATVTNNFSSANKLGEGGFGPVYKGQLLSGELVAVKRLSKGSGQGLEEFKNETELIAKLQHKNLVRILGCCVEQDEKILIYEYMSNKSLDSFLFDPKQEVLDWQIRVNIIRGIAQGLLYLHQYSRLRIVHRDLKASNILLDADMEPKISDFGLARIFGVNELQANTKRIVGTYGYMSPEYVLEGLFSTKSDVFAFGILVLEIMSGKKNTGYYGSDNLTLLGYVWELWKCDRVLEMTDPLLQISSSFNSVRYIIVGLLCVQENPTDRPSMSDVVTMLSNEQISLASPKQPAFTTWRSVLTASSNGGDFAICSANDVTISLMEAR